MTHSAASHDAARYRESIDDPQAFWARQATRIDWHMPPRQILDGSDPERARWFVGGKTNLCHNAVDRHLATRGDQAALIHVCGDTAVESVFSYAQLYREVSAMAAVLMDCGVRRGDRVLLYMPVIPETVFAMLACVRLGAIHTVVFGGFPAQALALRIDATQPTVILTAQYGVRGGVRVAYPALLDAALAQSAHQPAHCLCVAREDVGDDGDGSDHGDGRGRRQSRRSDGGNELRAHRGAVVAMQSYGPLRAAALGRHVDCVWLDSDAPSYILHTSGTTGQPKGIVRDTGGHAVALAASIDHQFNLQAGDTLFATSDLGWVVGHSYGVYAPLIAGLTTVLYEGTLSGTETGNTNTTGTSPSTSTSTSPSPSPSPSPSHGEALRRRDPDRIWRLLAKHRVTALLSAPAVMRLVQRSGLDRARRHDLSALQTVFLAGEPLDDVSAHAISDAIGKPVVDHYWQTETGSPIVAGGGHKADAKTPHSTHSTHVSAYAVPGFRLSIVDPETGARCAPGVRGIVALAAPLPPGCVHAVWGDDASGSALRRMYWRQWPMTNAASGVGEPARYSTSDWGMQDADGGVRLLGRADDAINVAGQRVGTREIEEVMRADPAIADVAVVGVPDRLRGQIPLAFVVLDPSGCRTPSPPSAPDMPAVAVFRSALQARWAQRVVAALGQAARPRRIFIVTGFPRTRSGKVMRSLIQQVFAGQACPDLQMIDDATLLREFADLPARLTCSAAASHADTDAPPYSPPGISASTRLHP